MTTTRPVSAADKLAQVLAEHVSEDHYAGNGYNEPREAWVVCSCGADIWEWQQFYNENPADPEDAFRAHLAAVVLAHLTAEGWAQGREEWGVRDADDPHLVQFYDDEQGARRRARLVLGGQPGALLHRRVTPWEPVETGDQE